MFYLAKLFVLFFICNVVYSQTSYFSTAQTVIGNSDYCGYATFSKLLHNIDMGGNKRCDVFLKFSSDPSIGPSFLGRYWNIPFFSSHIKIISRTRCFWISPNNGKYVFIKSYDKKEKGCTVYKQRGKDILILQNYSNGISTITSKRDSKFLYEYNKDGRLAKFRAGSEFDLFKLSYDANGFPVKLYNITKQKTELDFIYKDNHLFQIKIGNTDIAITFSYLYRTSSKVLSKEKLLSSVDYINGESEKYSYKSDEICTRNLLVNNKSIPIGGCIANRITITNQDKRSNWIEWDDATGFITSDSGGKYAIANPYFDNKNPEYATDAVLCVREKGTDIPKSMIAYHKNGAKFSGIWGRDKNAAIRFSQDENTGMQQKVFYIASSGMSYMKVRKIEKRENDSFPWDLVEQRIYDPNGNLLRIIENGRIIEHKNNILPDNTLKKDTYINGILMESKMISSNGELLEYIKYLSNEKKETFKYSTSDCQKTLSYYENDEFIYKKTFSKTWQKSDLLSMEDRQGLKTIYNYKGNIREELLIYPDGRKVLKKYDPNRKEFVENVNQNIIYNWLQSITNKGKLNEN